MENFDFSFLLSIERHTFFDISNLLSNIIKNLRLKVEFNNFNNSVGRSEAQKAMRESHR